MGPCYKTFYVRVIVPERPFQPSLMFAIKWLFWIALFFKLPDGVLSKKRSFSIMSFLDNTF